MVNVCVFCSASQDLSSEYLEVGRELGELLGRRDHCLVYGGSHLGLMGSVSKEFSLHSSNITEIIPRIFEDVAVRNHECIVTEDFEERLKHMKQRSDAFITLPGGLGSLHELLSIVVDKKFDVHDKPLIVVNTNGIYTPFIELVKKIIEEGMATEKDFRLISFVDSPKEAVELIERYYAKSIKE